MPSPWVLIVDDEPLIRWSLRAHLERAGFTVLDAGSGSQALERLDAHIGVALIDLRLPDTSGVELIMELKRRLPGCRVILMTAFGSQEVAREALASGAAEVVNKPFDLTRLTRTIQTTLDTGRA